MARKKIYLIRHGKTKANEEKRYAGKRTDTALSEQGIRECEKQRPIINEITGSTPDRICSGYMKRAVQTAELLFPRYEKLQICDLAEIDFGDFEGKNYEELNGNEAYQKWIDSNGKMDFPGGEGREAHTDYSLKVFNELLGDRDKDESIAVVCHGGNIMGIMMRLAGGDYYDYMCDNLGGYSLELETDHEGIHFITYHKLDTGNNT
ncbi:MAG: histidine phosphatase family protein [Lachnospiraceae bacterium]|nr:histidine phosphatase family protein [Lachnospiraceae bacterium]